MRFLLGIINIVFGFLGILAVLIKYLAIPVFLVFLVLKLCGVILWSWWLVCLPLIIFAITFSIIFCIVLVTN